jgi:hypothetical protein
MKYRKKPIAVEVIQWTGENYEDVLSFSNGKIKYNEGYQYNEYYINKEILIINTLEGELFVKIGDYIVKGVENEFWPVKKSIFEKTYEKVE